MSNVSREMVEERAHAIWREAGCPEGSSLQHWLQAEQELGVLPAAGDDDPIVTLHELAVDAQAEDQPPADESLVRSFDEAVPAAERLPGSFDDNPISEQVEEAGRERRPSPGSSTLQGGEAVP